jgi:DNA repair protein RecN (Recombination protein N)
VLAELRVRDLGVIEDLTVELQPGMTALTGETGAGKTLLVEALQLVLGQRADPSLVRTGSEEAMVEARFFDDQGAETVIVRSVPVNGRSRCWIDGRMAPVSALVEAGAALVDIQGQGEHQALLHVAAQRRALDAFGGIDTEDLEGLRRRFSTLTEELAALGGDEHERARELDVLAHQTRELDAAGLGDPEEDAHLAAEEDRLGDLTAHREQAAIALGSLDGDGEGSRALDLIGAAAGALDGRPAFASLEERLRAVQAETADIAGDLRSVVDTWDDDPNALASVQARRRMLADLYRKYGGDRPGALAFAEAARRRLDDLRQAEEKAVALEAQLRSVAAELRTAEQALLSVRSAAAPGLAAAVAARLEGLALEGARLEVEVAQRGAGEHVTFLFAANPGEALRPLARAASGGELARTMLALRLVAPGGPPTMVFDEVDAGVGGTAALALARALREVASSRQVLVVTHLAQVAAFAHHQVSVGKLERAGRVATSATTVSGSDRVVEISRMLSGQPDSRRAQAHAKELLELVGREEGVVAPS